MSKTPSIFIFHGTEGYPEENWFPWLKAELEAKGYKVIVPQFPSPPEVPAKISEWFEVLDRYSGDIGEDTVFVGHSLGGLFILKIFEKLDHKIKAAVFVGAPIGEKPLFNYERDASFSGFEFDWQNIKRKADTFIVYQSDNDPLVGINNGKKLAENLGVKLSFIPNAGHFNKDAGYTKFEDLRDKLLDVLGESDRK